jgi:hypothetical protein
MATTLYLSPIALILQQVFTNNGVMAQGGQATIYEAGTTTLAQTFTDSTGIVANANPITLNSAGRIASNSGAPIAVWAPSDVILKLVVTDGQGNQLIYLDQIQGINDPGTQASLQALLASPVSGNASGFGPVAGADLVANAVKSYDIFADVRAANTPQLASGQTLIIVVEGAVTIGDEAGGIFYWSAGSTADDDDATVLQPNSTLGAGRYLRLVLPSSSLTNSSGAFTGTLADGTNTGSGPVEYTVSNGLVTLRAAGLTMTSAADTMTMSGLPPALNPAGAQIVPCYLTDNGNSDLLGGFAIASNGAITFSLANSTVISGKIQASATGFTTSGTKGLANWSVTYELN